MLTIAGPCGTFTARHTLEENMTVPMKVAFGIMMLALSIAGCSGGDVCEQAYTKMHDCGAKLDCTSVTGAIAKSQCEAGKLVGSMSSYGDYKASCEKTLGAGQCECSGQTKTQAEAIVNGQLPLNNYCLPASSDTPRDTGAARDNSVDR